MRDVVVVAVVKADVWEDRVMYLHWVPIVCCCCIIIHNGWYPHSLPRCYGNIFIFVIGFSRLSNCDATGFYSPGALTTSGLCHWRDCSPGGFNCIDWEVFTIETMGECTWAYS